MGGSGTGEKDKEGNEEDLDAGQRQSGIKGQAQKGEEGAQGVALSGGVHPGVEIRKSQKTDGSGQVEERSGTDEKDGDDLHLHRPLPLEIFCRRKRDDKIEQGIDQ